MNLAKVAWDSGTPAACSTCWSRPFRNPASPTHAASSGTTGAGSAHGERTVRKLVGFGPAGFRSQVFSADGSVAATLEVSTGQSRSRNLLVYDTATGHLLHKIPFAESNANNSDSFRIALSADGKVIALGTASRLVRGSRVTTNQDWRVETIVWNLSDHRVLFHDSEMINASIATPMVSVSGDGSRLAIGWTGTDRSVPNASTSVGSFRVLDVQGDREYVHATSSTETPIAAELSSDGRLLATACLSMTGPNLVADSSSRLMIQEVETGRVRFDSGDQKSIRTVSFRFSPDGHRLAATSFDSSFATSLVIVDVDSGRRLATVPSLGSLIVSKLTFDRDGRSLVVASSVGPVAELRDAATGRLLRSLSLGVGEIADMVIRHSDGRLLVNSGEDIREWDLPPADPVSLDRGLVLKNVARRVRLTLRGPFVLTRDGRQLVLWRASTDPTQPSEFAVLDVTTGEVIRQFDSQEPGADADPNSQISLMRSNSTGTRLAAVIGNTSTADETTCRLRIWDLTSGRQLLTLDRERLGGLPAMEDALSRQAWNDAGTHVALSVRHADVQHDGKVVVRAKWFVAIVEVPSGRIVRRIPTAGSMPSASFRHDGELLAVRTSVAGVEGPVTRVELVDPDSGRVVLERRGDLPSSTGPSFFSPDGRRLAVFSGSGTNVLGRYLIWDLAPGAPPEPVRIDGPGAAVIAFSPDGRRLATASEGTSLRSGQVQLWDTATGRDLTTWSITGALPQDLAFDPEGHQLRVATFAFFSGEVGVRRFDATPLAPEIEAVDLVNKLGPHFPLNSELAARIESEPGLDSGVRAAALTMARERTESYSTLRLHASRLLELAAAERTPELMQRALMHTEHAMRRLDDPNVSTLSVLAEARYRNGRYSGALAPFARPNPCATGPPNETRACLPGSRRSSPWPRPGSATVPRPRQPWPIIAGSGPRPTRRPARRRHFWLRLSRQ